MFDLDYFYKGAISGATGLLCSHPIDTIKSNVQNGTKIKWNIRSLYRGVTPPLIGMGLEKAIVFGVYQNMVEHTNRTVAGALAGLACSFIVTPVDRLKIIYQTNQPKVKLNTLYRGFGNTITREMPGFAIYFNVYESLKSIMSEPNFYHHMMFGAVSGSLSWAFIYPQDMVKTQIQASSDKLVVDIIKNVYKNNGIRGFYRGFHLAVIRAIPLHAGTLTTYEYLNKK